MFRALARRKAVSRLTPEEWEIVGKPWLNTFPAITDWTSHQTPEAKLRQVETSGFHYRQIRDAIHRAGPHPRGLLLTNSDGFFSIYCLARKASRVDVFDVCGHVPGHEAWHLEQLRIVAKIWNFESKSSYQREDLFKIKGQWDFCVCTEVLNDLPDPRAAVAHIRQLVRGPMALLNTTRYPNEAGFFEAPCEDRPWGSRFTHDTLIDIVVEGGWTVVNERNKVMPEDWVGDRNLSYLHCV